MNLSICLSFVATVSILTITPGPSVLLATANSMKYGTRKVWGTILGDLSANLGQIMLASAGLASIVVSSGELFQVIKWCGVAYLVYMGLSKILKKPDLKLGSSSRGQGSFAKCYWEGFFMSAANPKAIVFFAALFPLFIQPEEAFWEQIFILALTFIALDGISLWVYARFAAQLKRYLENQEKVYLQNKIVGGLLIGSAVMLSLVKRAGK